MTEYTYKYEMPSITADTVLFRDNNGLIEVLLIKRKNEPFQGMRAIPGGFGSKNETLIQTASRECFEETGIVVHNDDFRFVGFFDKPERDPRGWVVTAVFATFIEFEDSEIAKAGDDAESLEWVLFDAAISEKLAFDHNDILFKAFLNYFGGDTYGS